MVMAYNVKELFLLQHHASRVGEYAQELAYRMGCSEELCMKAFFSGIYHDLGKLFIPDVIISKQEKLTPDELLIVKKHVAYGCDFLKPFNIDPDIFRAIEEHHEHLDGTGYPNKLMGDDISLLGRILAVADKFDALTSDRVYRKAFSYKDAISILKDECASHKIDVDIFNCLAEIVVFDGHSNHIELSEFMS